MTYKTIIMCVLFAGSMQNAWGMENKQVTPLGVQQPESKDSKLKQYLKSIMLCECLGLRKNADQDKKPGFEFSYKSETESPEIIFEGSSMGNETQNPPIIFEGGSIDVQRDDEIWI